MTMKTSLWKNTIHRKKYGNIWTLLSTTTSLIRYILMFISWTTLKLW